jgi:uroporphyrinogen decarboxylase
MSSEPGVERHANGPVLLVRARGGEDGDADALQALGLAVIEDPYLVVATCTDDGATARAEAVLDALRSEAELLLLTSRAALRALDALVGREALVAAVRDGKMRGLWGAAVGPSTADALRDLGLADVLEPEVATSRGLLAALRERPGDGSARTRRAVLPCGAQAMKGLGAGLVADGWQVDEVVVYVTDEVDAVPQTVPALVAGRIPVVVLRSPTAVRAVARHVPVLPAVTVAVCGGPTTAAAAEDAWGVTPVVSDGPTADAVARTVSGVLAGTPERAEGSGA